MHEVFAGDILTDFPFIEASFGLRSRGRRCELWVLRGLRDGVVTTRWPRGPMRTPTLARAGHRRAVTVIAPADPRGLTTARLSGSPRQGAISTGRSGSTRAGAPLRALRRRTARTCSPGQGRTGRARALCRGGSSYRREPETDQAISAASGPAWRQTAALRRCVHVRHVDAGSDGSEEWEILALLGPVYDVHRLGMFFTASPRHADVLMVTGAGTPG